VAALDVLLHSSPQLYEGARRGRILEQGPVYILGAIEGGPPDNAFAVLLVSL
jgi:hypothetical protein